MEIGCCDLFARGRFCGGYLACVSLYFAASNIYTEIDVIQYILLLDGFMSSKKVNKYKASKLLVESGYINGINWKDEKGLLPLFIFTSNGNIEIMTLLLESKADTEVKDQKGAITLCAACQEGNSSAVGSHNDW